jgi:tyrocidine synthetase-3
MLNLSAKNKESLEKLVRLYIHYLTKNKPNNLDNICYTASAGRSHFKHRLSLTGQKVDEIIQKLNKYLSDQKENLSKDNEKKEWNRKIVWMFSGQGTQYIGMGKELYQHHPVFKEALDRCDTLFKPIIKDSLKQLLYKQRGEERLEEPIINQPAIFSIEYALAKYWESMGITPTVVIGHSIGEYAAACIAGVFTLEDAVRMIGIRARLMQDIPRTGKMVGILTSEEKIQPYLSQCPDVSIAAVNSDENITISGHRESVEKILEQVKRSRIFVEKLTISHAFHSNLMKPYIETFKKEIIKNQIQFKQPEIEFLPLCGTYKDPIEYWAQQLRHTVRFNDHIKQLKKIGYDLFLEIGSTATLSGLASQSIQGKDTLFLPSMRRGKDPWEQATRSLSALYEHGAFIDWEGYYRPKQEKMKPDQEKEKLICRTSKVRCPTYPFNRKRYFLERVCYREDNINNSTVPRKSNPEKEDSEKSEQETMDIKKVTKKLENMIYTISGLQSWEIDGNANMFSLGMDSLMLVELRRKINGEFDIDITLNQFFMEFTTLNKIREHILKEIKNKLPLTTKTSGDRFKTQEVQENLDKAIDQNSLSHFMTTQLQILQQVAQTQLETLKEMTLQDRSGKREEMRREILSKKEGKTYKPLDFTAIADHRNQELTTVQKQHMENLVNRYTKRTKTSKTQTQQYRKVLADSKATVGFNISLKEMHYPLTGKRALGSRIWDVDDNEYIDITMGFGVYLFGHYPGFLKKSRGGVSHDNTELGPRSYLVGEVAERISRMTGLERVTFTNTGTEAIMTAIRLARSATGRTRIAIFSRSYHGHSDSTLAVSITKKGKIQSEPVSPGIPFGITDEVLVLDYLEPGSLEILRQHSGELAAILVEPVQSRFPAVDPRDFLHELRQITRDSGTVLIFDEMITGFRLHPGGAQAYFGVEADICTYGKIIGGGLPIGVIAGKARYLDGIDGGYWEYGDASYPGTERTFFGGTFCQYHEAMESALFVLKYLEEQGPDLQDQLNQKTRQFAETLNLYFKKNQLKIQLSHFSSMFRFDIIGGNDLFFYHLLEKGVYVWEWRSCFLSTAHTQEDIDQVVEAVKETVEELEQGGFSLRRAEADSAKKINKNQKGPKKLEKDYVPMTSVQKRLYAISKTKDGNRAYQIPIMYQVKGKLDVLKLQKSFMELIKRHETLRTGFEIKGEQFLQRIFKHHEVKPFFYYKKKQDFDLKNITQLAEDLLFPFDLSRPPLFRVSITEITETHFLLVMNFHHIIIDGVSMPIFMRELSDIYKGNTLSPVMAQYREYAFKEENFLNSSDFKKHEAFWIEQLGKDCSPAELPVDFRKPELTDFSGSICSFKIDNHLTQQLKQMARDEKASLNMVLLSVFNILLYKLTRQEDQFIIIPAVLKEQQELENTIGMFTNLFVVRAKPSYSKTFFQLLEEVKHHCLGAYAYQAYPYAELISKLKKINKAEPSEFFHVAFGFEAGNPIELEIPGLHFTLCECQSGATPYEFFLEIVEDKGCLNAEIRYNKKRYKQGTIELWKGYLIQLIYQILEKKGTTIENLDIMSEEQKKQLLEDFNDTGREFSEETTISALFEEQVQHTPDFIAITTTSPTFGSRKKAKTGDLEKKEKNLHRVTYQQLSRQVDGVAGILVQKGITRNSVVGLLVERSVEMIIGIFAILKAGGGYLPLEPDFPQKRIQYMLEDSQANLLVADQWKERPLPGCSELLELNNLTGKGFIPENPTDFPITHHPATTRSLAYIIYTSGSTGKPKGVITHHENVIRVVKKTNYITFLPREHILQLSNYAFDGSVFDIYGALLNEGNLVILEGEKLPIANGISEIIKTEKIDLFFVTTALFNTLVDIDIHCFDKVRHVLFGGERVSVEHTMKVVGQMGVGKVLHMYGPTETTVYATYYPVPLMERNAKTIPIGGPITNRTLYILDKMKKLVPMGVGGDLYIGGQGVVPGYLNNPELTAEKFVKKIFNDDVQDRLYRSGDLARRLADGNLEFIGREDQQVKLRGFRVELGEIESACRTHEKIKEAVVLLRDRLKNQKSEHNNSTEHYLCAYIVSETGTPPTPSELREYLTRELPQFMIPLNFVFLDTIPLTPNGKIDKKALPEPMIEEEKSYTAPRNSIEKRLVQLWSGVLNLKEEDVGIESNFFQLGGNSLNATLIINKIQKEFKVDIDFKELLESPQIKHISQKIIGSPREGYCPINPVEEREYYTVSTAQKRMVILQQKDKTSTSYNMPFGFQVQGAVQNLSFERICTTLIKRHQSLRTSFLVTQDHIVQKIHKRFEFRLKQYGTGHQEMASEEIQKIRDSFVTPFDLAWAPLFRAIEIRVHKTSALYMLDMHHSISDGLSLKVFLEELKEILSGETLKEMRIQYRDFSQWQNQLAKSGKLKNEEDYWKKQFPDEIPVLELPLDFSRPAKQNFEGSSIGFKIGDESYEFLIQLSHQTGITMNMLFLTLYYIFLVKITGQTDIVIGTPVSGRRHPDLQGIMGMCVNTLALRNQMQGKKTVMEFLEEVKESVLKSYENQDYPYEDLVEQILKQRDMSRNPIFDVMFSYQGKELSLDYYRVVKDEFSITPFEYNEHTSKFDFTLFVSEKEDSLECTIEYATRLFKSTTIERWISFFNHLIKQVLNNPRENISEIEIISPGEKETILVNFNKTRQKYPGEKTIIELFEEQVGKYPDYISAAEIPTSKETGMEITDLTYRELGKEVFRVALGLKREGVQFNWIVALLMYRSIQMIIAILGVLKAGAVYLPIDQLFPKKRIQYMLKESNARILLSNLEKVEPFSSIVKVLEFKRITRNENFHSPQKELFPKTLSSLSNYAYIIYTSGSTGKPKGVLTHHRNVIRVVKNTNYITLYPGDKILQLSNYAFDVSVFDIFGALLNGAELLVLKGKRLPPVEEVGEIITRNRVTVFFVTTALFNTFAEIKTGCFERVRLILFGGEKVSLNHTQKAFKRVGPGKLIHVYGPTETTVFATYSLVDKIEEEQTTIPIGKPISNTTSYILDKHLKPVPLGIKGEIYIGGEGVANGYLNQPELTRERFINLPGQAGLFPTLVYRTGDLGRWNSDGEIEFVGREDKQLKIRGFRVEAGEIQDYLSRYPGVCNSVVTGKRTGEGDTLLCAYLEVDIKIEEKGIRDYLSKNLPDYMIPVYFVFLDTIPLTPNGKVDIKALPEPFIKRQQDYQPPLNALQEKLVELWSQVLNTEKEVIGIDTNFFRLGGHSLKATILMNRMQKEFSVEIELKEVLEQPYIRKISQIITSAKKREYQWIHPKEKKEYYRISSAQKRLYLVQQMEVQSTAYNMPLYFRLTGPWEPKKIEHTLKKLKARHESLRTSFHMQGEQLIQRIAEKSDIKLELYAPGNERKQMKEFVRPFDLSSSSLLRAGIIEAPSHQKIFMIDMHHIISDGISITIFLEEFRKLFEGQELNQLKIQYKDFTEWQELSQKTAGLKSQKLYWKEQFQGGIPLLNLPYDYTRPTVQAFKGRAIGFDIEKGIRGFIQEVGTTPYMVFLGIFTRFLSMLTGQEDVVVGTPIAGRNHPDLEGMIGMCVNSLGMRTQPRGTKSFIEYLEEVKRTTIQAYENQDYLFEELVEEVVHDRDLSRNPIFDVMMAIEGKEFNLSYFNIGNNNLQAEYEEQEKGISKFDLTLFIEEKEDNYCCAFEYSISLFREETMKRYCNYFSLLLSNILKEPATAMTEIGMIPENERRMILQDFNDTLSWFPKHKLIHQLFEEKTEMIPDYIAISGGTLRIKNGKDEACITYAQLNNESHGLSHFLSKKGIKIQTVTGILMDRSLEMIVTMMAILKAGSGYLPIEPGYPIKRILYLLKESNTKFIVMDNPKAFEVTKEMEKAVNIISWEHIKIKEMSNTGPASVERLPASSLAYIIYTSGSTGNPKGVMTHHYNVIRVVKNTNYIEIGAKDRILQLSNYAFDGSIFDIFGSLLNGAVLEIMKSKELPSLFQLSELIVLRKITVFFVTTALFNTWVDLHVESLTGVRKLLFGGERVSTEHTGNALRRLGKNRLIHVYGPTETTVYATYYPVNQVEKNRRTIPIGKPISNTFIYILDRRKKIVPLGVCGEIYIGGEGVANGYLNQPELTKERFVNITEHAGQITKEQAGLFPTRVYRTGDLGLWNSDGEIEFIGREDQQVKIRGFRIELGEIEQELLKYTDIKKAVVLLYGEERYLCAYFEAAEQPGIEPGVLRERLALELPAYMIPTFFVNLKKIPLTPNGKIDKQALPEPQVTRGIESQEPKDRREQQLAGLWSDVLKMDKEKISRESHFFNLGGHSLRANLLVSKIFGVFGVRIPLNQVFKTPTLSAMAHVVKTASIEKELNIPMVEKREWYELSFNQERLWVIHQRDPQSNAFNMPETIKITGKVNIPALKKAIQEITKKHPSFRTGFRILNHKPVQFLVSEVEISLEESDISEFKDNRKETEKAEISGRFSREKFDLRRPPLLRLLLLKTGKTYYELYFNMHHIISDGGSLELFKREFLYLYKHYRSRKKVTKIPLKYQYTDFALWQKRWVAQLGEKNESLQYWRKIVSQGIPLLKFPKLFHGDQEDLEGAVYRKIISEELKEKIKKLSIRKHTTLFVVLFAAYLLVIRRYTHQQDLISSVISAGRPHDSFSEIIGFFVNSILFRITIDDQENFERIIKRVHHQVMNCRHHQEYPLEKVFQELKMQYPDIPVSFNMINLWDESPEKDLEIYEPYHRSNLLDTKFDIQPYIIEYKNGLDTWWSYKKSVFNAATIETFVKDYVGLLEYFMEQPDQSYNDYQDRRKKKKKQFSKGLRKK